MWPGKKSGDNKADTLARPGRRKGHDMVGAVMAEIGALGLSQEHASWFQET